MPWATLRADDARDVRVTARPGMGLCQGRVCGFALSKLVATQTGADVDAARPRILDQPTGGRARRRSATSPRSCRTTRTRRSHDRDTTHPTTASTRSSTARCAARPSSGSAPTIADRARALVAVADALDAHADELIPIAQRETHLAEPRLRGELRRTTFQLRMFAEMLPEGLWLDARIDHADPEWPMGAPRPDLRRQLEPIGATLVFAASNFPFAFSVAGGDTASALAAGNAVVLKAHPGHPELSDATTDVVVAALAAAGAPEGALPDDPRHRGRRARAACARRQGRRVHRIGHGEDARCSTSPRRAPSRSRSTASSAAPTPRSSRSAPPSGMPPGSPRDFVASVTGSAGQLCTKPGVLFVPAGLAICSQSSKRSSCRRRRRLLNGGIESGFRDAVASTARRRRRAHARRRRTMRRTRRRRRPCCSPRRARRCAPTWTP